MYQAIYYDYFTKNAFVRDDKEGWVQFEYRPTCFKITPGGKYKTLDGKRADFHPNINRDDKELYETDVDINLRVLLSSYLESDEVPMYQNRVFLDIECERFGAINLENCQKAKGKITAVALYDENGKEYTVYVLDEKRKLQTSKKGDVTIIACRTEKELFQQFLIKWQEIDPTILVHWNGDGFDVPYLYSRMKRIVGEDNANKLSPLGIVKLDEFDKDMPYKIAGVNSMDYMRLYKKFIPKQQPSYSLNNICLAELKKGKIEYQGSLDRLFEEDVNKFIEYNVNDVRLIVELDAKKKFIELAVMLAHMGHVPYHYVYQSSRLIEGAIMTYLKRNNIVSVNKPTTINPELKKQMLEESEDDDKFAGAYVKEPVPGLYGWNIDEDLTSLYPSLGIMLNCGLETFMFKILTDDPFDDSWNVADMREKNGEATVQIERIDGRTKEMKLKNLIELIVDNDIIVSPNGVAFDSQKSSVIVDIMLDWFKKRKEFKNKMKEAGHAGDTKLYEYYDRIQQIMKIFLNSIYGVLGLKSFRYTDGKDYIASAITSGGRLTIMRSADYVNDKIHRECEPHLKHPNDYVIMSDTDSLYIDIRPALNKHNIDHNNDEAVVNFARNYALEISDEVNAYYQTFSLDRFNSRNNRLEIKSETIGKTLYVSAKKQYAQFIVDKEGVPIKADSDKAFDFKGLDFMKASYPKLFRDFTQGLMKDILFNKPKSSIDKQILVFRERFKTLDMKDVAKPSGINKLKENILRSPRAGQIFSTPTKGTLAHIKAAMYHNDLLRFKGLDVEHSAIQVGDKIRWMYLCNNPYSIDVLGFNPEDTAPEIVTFVEKYMDREAMFDKNLVRKLEKIYENLGWGAINFNKNVNRFFRESA